MGDGAGMKSQEFKPDWYITPIDMLFEYISDSDVNHQGFSSNDVKQHYSLKYGDHYYINEFFDGKVDVNQNLDDVLSEMLGTSQGFWMRIQAICDEAKSRPGTTRVVFGYDYV